MFNDECVHDVLTNVFEHAGYVGVGKVVYSVSKVLEALQDTYSKNTILSTIQYSIDKNYIKTDKNNSLEQINIKGIAAAGYDWLSAYNK